MYLCCSKTPCCPQNGATYVQTKSNNHPLQQEYLRFYLSMYHETNCKINKLINYFTCSSK